MKEIIKGNPYTHEEHSRIAWLPEELDEKESCAWCGQRNKYNGLFEYNNSGQLFCSMDCFKSYTA